MKSLRSFLVLMGALLALLMCVAAAALLGQAAGDDQGAEAAQVGLIATLVLLTAAGLVGTLAGRRVIGAAERLQALARRIAAGQPPQFEPTGLREIDDAGLALDRAARERDLNQERFDLAQEVGGIGSWEWDILRDEGFVSDTYKRMHGLSHVRGPLRIGQVLATIHPDDLPGYQARLAAAKLRPGPSTNHYRVVHDDGAVRWIEAKGRPLFDGDGRLTGAVGIVRDATAEQEALQSMRQAQERLALATAALGLGIWDWRLDTGEIHYSPRAREICGFTPDEVLTFESIAAVVHPRDLPVAAAQTRSALDPQVRAVSPYEYRIVRQDGVRWLRAQGRTVFDAGPEGERAVRYIGTLEDITERRAVAERLETSEARLRLTLMAGRMAALDWPLDSEDVPLTDELRALFGLEPGEASTERQRRVYYHPDDAERVAGVRQRALQGGERFIDFEFRYFWPDGQMRWFQVRSQVMGSAAGRPERLVGVMLDVTDHRQNQPLGV